MREVKLRTSVEVFHSAGGRGWVQSVPIHKIHRKRGLRRISTTIDDQAGVVQE